jgi:error-prone DNA polymerase
LVAERKTGPKFDQYSKLIQSYASRIVDMPSHLSIHAGGMLISEKSIYSYTATHIPPKGFPVTQFSMLEAEDIGLYKFDILSQRGLGHIRDTVDIVRQNRDEEIDIHRISDFKKDERIRNLLRQGKCMGCFYVESPAMRMLLAKMKCETYLALVAASSIIRPGVARSGMMREFIYRYLNPDKVQYIHPLMKELMEETYGVMVYQEDVIKVAHHFAGLTLSESDVLRRGMSGKFRSREEFMKIRDRFFSNCRQKGYPEEITAEVWRQIESFAGYSFSKGHSASYAVESYQSLYLKAYYPLEFMVGVINNFGGFYTTEFYVHEARMNGARIHAPCINNSGEFTGISGKDIYLGFVHLSGIEQKTIRAIIKERHRGGAFSSLNDFSQRVSISMEQLRILIRINAFRFTKIPKKELLWHAHGVLGEETKTTAAVQLFSEPDEEYTLPELCYHEYDDAFDELELLGFTLSSPFSLLTEPFNHPVRAAHLKQNVGKPIEIMGYLVTYKPTRTVKGDEMAFGTFLDADGCFFDTTHFPDMLRKYPIAGRACYRIAGKVTEDFGYPSIEVTFFERLKNKSR